MNGPGARAKRTVLAFAAVALVTLAVAWWPAGGRTSADASWLLLGWVLMSACHVAGGGWMAARHGLPGTGFLLALLATLALRVLAAAGGGVAAALTGKHAVVAYVWGLAAGFLPLQFFEMYWFLRMSRSATTAPLPEGR